MNGAVFFGVFLGFVVMALAISILFRHPLTSGVWVVLTSLVALLIILLVCRAPEMRGSIYLRWQCLDYYR